MFQRFLDAQKEFGTGILAEMKADREVLRAEFAGQREAIAELREEVGGLRDALRKLPPVAP